MSYDEIFELLENERKYAELNYVPIIREKSAKFLYDFIKENNFKTILEIGTAIGYSGSIILSTGIENLTTIDKNQDYLNIAKDTFKKFNFKNVDINLGDAKYFIRDLVKENRKFDMVFLDGAKGQYINYLPELVKLLNEGGVIFADNVLLHGMVESNEYIPHKKRTMVVNLRKYLEIVNNDPYETELIRVEDGIAITKYKGVR